MLVTDGVTLNVHYSNEYSISKQYQYIDYRTRN